MSTRLRIAFILALAVTSAPAIAGTTDNPNGVIDNSNVTVALKQVFTTDSSGAIQMTTAPGDPTGLYVTARDGKIYRYDTANPGAGATLWFNLTATTAPAFTGAVAANSIGSSMTTALSSGADASGDWGLAFAPDYATSGKFYTYADEKYTTTGQSGIGSGYTGNAAPTYAAPETAAGATTLHENVLREWVATNPGVNATVSASQASRKVISIGNPGGHNAGDPQFGPDGDLYFTTGDGGGNGDGDSGSITNATDGFTGNTTVAAISNGQDLTNPLGKVIRIDPNISTSHVGETLSANGQYYIPNNNPYVGQNQTIPGRSATAELGEIYANGLRNPWKFSWDSATGKMYLSNVGQHQMESIVQIQNGTNAGWPFQEGGEQGDQYTARVNQIQALPGGSSYAAPLANTMGSSGVILTTYPTRWTSNGNQLQNWTGDGSGAVAGFVYHGQGIPALDGMFIFGDLQFIGGTGAKNGAGETIDEAKIFFVDPNDPNDETATIYNTGSPNTFGATNSQVNVGVQSYEINFAPGQGPPNATGSSAATVLYGFGLDSNPTSPTFNELYVMFSNGTVYELVAAPEPTSIIALSAGALVLLQRRRSRFASR